MSGAISFLNCGTIYMVNGHGSQPKRVLHFTYLSYFMPILEIDLIQEILVRLVLLKKGFRLRKVIFPFVF